ncbi:MAG TPA: sigma-70 family RNA polymerase sigma factor [Gemmataceae bacterium]|jgi:RNA polymerase sigma-70 factor (ECF subfamily)
MSESLSQSAQIQVWLDRLRGGDAAACEQLLRCACQRLRNLARRMLRFYPNVQRWEQTDDVMQNAALRLYRTLQQIPVQTVRDFFRLAALNIRRELLDLAKHYYGPQGHGARHASISDNSSSKSPDVERLEPLDLSHEPSRVAAWSEFHQQIEKLPELEREVFDLLWYQGLSQAEVAKLLQVSERTVKRRWLSARLALSDALKGEIPG